MAGTGDNADRVFRKLLRDYLGQPVACSGFQTLADVYHDGGFIHIGLHGLNGFPEERRGDSHKHDICAADAFRVCGDAEGFRQFYAGEEPLVLALGAEKLRFLLEFRPGDYLVPECGE